MKFSCTIGAYNPKIDWLKRALDSTIELFDEIILVDDGSSNYEGILKLIGDNKYNVKYVRHDENEGFCEARNTAIRNSTGDVICSLDDDDWFDKDGVVALKEFIRNNDSDIWHFILKKFNEETGLYGQDAIPEHLYSYNSIPSQSWFKKSMWEELGGYKKVKAEDWNLWVRALNAKKKFTYFPRIAYNLNRRSDSISAKWTGVSFDMIRKEVFDNL